MRPLALNLAQGDNLFGLLGQTAVAASPAQYMLVAAMVMIPTVWLPDLSSLSFLGAAGVTATCTVMVAVSGRAPMRGGGAALHALCGAQALSCQGSDAMPGWKATAIACNTSARSCAHSAAFASAQRTRLEGSALQDGSIDTFAGCL